MSSRRVLMAVPKYVFPVVGGRSAHELGKALVQGRDAVHALSSHFYPSQDDVELVDGVCVHRVKVDRVRTEFFSRCSGVAVAPRIRIVGS